MRAIIPFMCSLALLFCVSCERKRVGGKDAPPPHRIEHVESYHYPYPDHDESCSPEYIETLRAWLEHVPTSQKFVRDLQPLQPHPELATAEVAPTPEDIAITSIYLSPMDIWVNDADVPIDEFTDRLARGKQPSSPDLLEAVTHPPGAQVYEIGFHPDTPLTRVRDLLARIPMSEGDTLRFMLAAKQPQRIIEPLPHHAEQYLVLEEGAMHPSERTVLAYADVVERCDGFADYTARIERMDRAARRDHSHAELATIWGECGCPGDLDAVMIMLLGGELSSKPMYEMHHVQHTVSPDAKGLEMHTQGKWAEYYASFIGEPNSPLCISNLGVTSEQNALACAMAAP